MGMASSPKLMLVGDGEVQSLLIQQEYTASFHFTLQKIILKIKKGKLNKIPFFLTYPFIAFYIRVTYQGQVLHYNKRHATLFP